ncbi:MAG: DUF1361 domain-containing protein [Spirochaetes bacterium]|nr:DUF1361 domain-containing protein [Spirochaetota bacterium]
MLDYVKNIVRIKSTVLLAVISLYAIFLSILRVIFTGKSFFLFMFWNLFLAFLPWFIASLLYVKQIFSRTLFFILVITWLAFFPNAPYILTDIIHLGKEHSAPVWYDLILLLSYGFAGMLYGFVSLKMIEEMTAVVLKIRFAWLFSIVLIYISCFGIYLGRFLRWNSWDLLTNLDNVLKDVIVRIVNPFQHPTAWVFTFLFGTLLNLLYWSYKVFSNERN